MEESEAGQGQRQKRGVRDQRGRTKSQKRDVKDQRGQGIDRRGL